MGIIPTTLVKELRNLTGCGIKDCKKALIESDGDIEKSVEYLRKKGLADAAKKSGRGTNAGRVISYIHAGGQVGVLLELDCETDFVANTEDFQDLGKDLCMQICAMNPIAVNREEISAEVIEKEKNIYREQMQEALKGKPASVQDKILDGKLKKFYQESVLIEQAFVKEESRTVEDIIKEKIGTIKENITVKRFVRFQVGE